MDLVSKLYQSSHRLLHLGEDGSPIYANVFSELNTEVHQLADQLYPLRGDTPESEALHCLSLLMGYSATIYGDSTTNKRKQVILDRSVAVLEHLAPSLLKCRLLLYCYAEAFDKELLDEARVIIESWGGRELTNEELEMLEFQNDLLQNPNSL